MDKFNTSKIFMISGPAADLLEHECWNINDIHDSDAVPVWRSDQEKRN